MSRRKRTVTTMSNSSLVSVTKISPNKTSPRVYQINKITIHHMAGDFTVEQCLNGFANPDRYASANYVIGSDGRIGLCVEEKDRAWTSGNYDNDQQAITIEVANDKLNPSWHVSDKALQSLLDLCVDICKRNKIKKLFYTGDVYGNLTVHNMFQATLCPGAYLQGKIQSHWIENIVNARLVGRIGDVNGDGKINAKDVTAIMKYLAVGAMVDHVLADINGDGKVNAKDVTALMKKLTKGGK